jgi:ribonuclease T
VSIPDLTSRIAGRFRGFLPVVVDVETGGFNANSDALLELAAVLVEMTPGGELRLGATHRYHIQPFHGSRIDPAALAVNGIDPHHPLRPAMPEKEALTQLFREVRKAVRDAGCTRAILVGHNASFDLGFLNAAGLAWDPAGAHSAIYDAERTAALFCTICNRFRFMYEDALERAPELAVTEPEAPPEGE